MSHRGTGEAEAAAVGRTRTGVTLVEGACICTVLIMASHGLGSRPGSATYWAVERGTSLSQPQFPHYQMREPLPSKVANRPRPPSSAAPAPH